MLNDETFRDIQIFEDMNKVFDLTIYVGNKTSCFDITEKQAEKLKTDLGIDIIYIPF